MIAKTFYQIAKTMECNDILLGMILRELLENKEKNALALIFQKYDVKILEEDSLFYYKLGSQFINEKKYIAAYETLSIYDMILTEDIPKY